MVLLYMCMLALTSQEFVYSFSMTSKFDNVFISCDDIAAIVGNAELSPVTIVMITLAVLSILVVVVPVTLSTLYVIKNTENKMIHPLSSQLPLCYFLTHNSDKYIQTKDKFTEQPYNILFKQQIITI